MTSSHVGNMLFSKLVLRSNTCSQHVDRMAMGVMGQKSLPTRGRGFLLTGMSSPIFQMDSILKASVKSLKYIVNNVE